MESLHRPKDESLCLWFIRSYATRCLSIQAHFPKHRRLLLVLSLLTPLRFDPNYKLMGPIYSYFYLLRPVFWTYITYRLTRMSWFMIKRHWAGKDDPHYFWFYDTLYPDLLHDADDMKYINFRYTDNKVTPDPMTGYYPHDNMRYGDFINKKEDNRFVDSRLAASQIRENN